jgi:superfamily II DNA/RNA helicase
MSDIKFNDYNLSEDIIKAIKLLGYENPTKVQREVIPFGLKGNNLVVKSQTGSGKTAAFGIPLCEKIEIEVKEPQALILTPTRELCVQIKEDITNIGRFKKVRCAAVFGKQPVDVQVRELRQRVHVVAGTPGRTKDLIDRGYLNIERVKYLIIDEADKMLNMGFIDQVEDVIKLVPKNRITMLFSATMPEEIERLYKNYMKDAVNIEIEPENITTDNIEQVLLEVSEYEKPDILSRIIYTESPDSCIIFCSTKENVDKVYGKLRDREIEAERLHGGMLQNDRLKIMQSFKRGEFRFLVATDVAARGIDIESLSHIINYDVPVEKESYVHRIGRTGRAGKTGKAITFSSEVDKRYLREIENYIGYEIPKGNVPSREESGLAKQLFNEKNKAKPKIKADKGERLSKEITKIYIGAGKKKKVRAGDIVGAITSIDEVSADDIGIIDVQENHSYVDILGGKGKLVLEGLRDKTIKGKTVKIEKAAK